MQIELFAFRQTPPVEGRGSVYGALPEPALVNSGIENVLVTSRGIFFFTDVPGIPHGAIPPSSRSMSQQPSGLSEAVLHFLHCTFPTV